ncbi:DUF2127 domain-containing protein [Patescibacteria group bacterium]|nr:DUF2127 domain-containing protein [Patescibacteria group bacterium]
MAAADKQESAGEKEIRWFFDGSLILKGVHAVIEILSGLFLALATTGTIVNIVNFFTQDEITEDPHDAIANYLVHSVEQLTGSGKFYGALYLISHGVINGLLVWGLLRRKLWSYPLAIVVLGLFVAYQVYQWNFNHSLWLLFLSVFDLTVLWLIWLEWRIIKRHNPAPKI